MNHIVSRYASILVCAAAAALAGITLAPSPASAAATIYNLGTLGGTRSFGTGVNDAGQVAGWSNLAGDTAAHAFRYDGTPDAGGIVRDLGTFGEDSLGTRINNAGQVAGNSQITGNTTYHAFLYTGTPGAGGQMFDLDDWLNANNPAEGAKWTLSEAADISNTGWITGNGLYDPDGPGGVAAAVRAYLLDASVLSGIPGDFNRNGIVDAADYVVWRKNGGAQEEI